MKTTMKALSFAVLFTPAVVMAAPVEIDQATVDLYHGAEKVMTVDGMEQINMEIKQQPSAAGAANFYQYDGVKTGGDL
jgi:hypothetical protein